MPLQPQDDFKETLRETIEGMLSPSNSSFVWHSIPTWQIDLKGGTARQTGQHRFRARRVPKDADLRQVLLTAYVGIVHQSYWFKQWRKYLRAHYAQFRPSEGAANESTEISWRETPEPGFRVLEGEKGASYPEIHWRAIASVSEERRYLCRGCGLHAVAAAIFGTTWLGETGHPHNTEVMPSFVHEWVWEDDDSMVLMLAQLKLAGAWHIEPPSGGHGSGLRGLTSLEDVVQAATWLFWNQVREWPPFKITQRWSEALGQEEFGEDKVKNWLDGVRALLGIRRPVGAHVPVGQAPKQWSECIPRCHPYGAPRRS